MLGGETNIENWRIRHILRGHGSHVVDLGWSPDDSRMATTSLDSTVAIWDTSTGGRVATLRAHTSFVKGVAWDPVGTYLATFSEDKSLAIWRTDDFSLVATVTDPFERMVTATFACRVSWSPDGRFLIAGNSFQGATHAAVAVPREAWNQPDEYLLVSGHGGAVVTAAFNPKLFKVPPLGGGPPSEELSAIFAMGGQDKRVTVWSSSEQRPLFCGARLFKSQVLDVAWTPNGLALLASSSDGTVACLQFDSSEFGAAASAADMSEVMRALYGSTEGRPNKRVFAESAEQLDLEESVGAGGDDGKRLALAPIAVPQQQQQQQQQVAAGPTRTGDGPAAAVLAVPSAAAGSSSTILAALDARLGGGPAAAGAITQTGFGTAATTTTTSTPATMTTSTAPLMTQRLMPPPPPRPSGAAQQQDPKRARLEMVATPTAATAVVPARGTTATATPTTISASQHFLAALRPSPSLRVPLGAASPLIVSSSSSSSRMTTTAAAAVPYELKITNKESRPPQAEVLLIRGTINSGVTSGTVNSGSNGGSNTAIPPPRVVWQDVIPGSIVAATGTPFFTALATSDGHVVLHTPAGRRSAPPLCIGTRIALMATGGSTRLLLVSTTGKVKVLDALTLEEVMEAELRPLVEDGSTGVLDVRMSTTTTTTTTTTSDTEESVPVVTLTNASAYVWHKGLRSWLRVADDSIAVSRFAPVPRVPGQGELAEVQSMALGGGGASAGLIAARSIRGNNNGSDGVTAAQQHLARGILESNLTASEALGSAEEYKAWLRTYARTLAEAGDENRLRELSDSLMGPPPGSNRDGDGPGGWTPMVLGMSKRELLRGVVLREAARNRGMGALLQRCRQALDEVESAAAAAMVM